MRGLSRSTITGARQRGISTLLTTLIVLTTITFIVIYTSRTVQLEQKMSANDYRSRMAFEAAEAGQEAAIAAINNGWTRDAEAALIANNVVYDTLPAGAPDGVPDTNTMVFDNGSRVTVTLTDATPPSRDYIATKIVAVGESDDRVANRTIEQIVAHVPPLPNTPDNPVSARGSLVVNGSATIHNPEGHSTIWTGGNVGLGSNNATTTEIADRNDAEYPDCLGGSTQCDVIRSSDRYIAGLDIIENDSSLANLSGNEFFANFFGMKPATFRDSKATVKAAAANVQNATDANPPGANGGLSEIIWVDGGGTPDPDGATTINGLATGCVAGSCDAGQEADRIAATDPVIMIFDGDLVLSGNVDIFGLLYVTGNLTVSGNVTVAGAIVVQGNMSSNVGGSMDVWYNARILRSMNDDTPASGGGGTWRDF